MSNLAKYSGITRNTLVDIVTNLNIHGLTLFVPCPTETNPNRGINCRFDDFAWLNNNPDPCTEPFSSLPALGVGSKRIQVWMQGNKGSSRYNYTDPKKALEKLDYFLSECNKTYKDIMVIWSHPRNQPEWQQEEPTPTPVEQMEGLPGKNAIAGAKSCNN